MKTLFLHLWSRLRTSFWFIPGLIVSAAAAAGYGTLAIDRMWGMEIIASMDGLRDVSAEGIRSLLSTAATSVLTLAGVTFSATLVALTLASSQFGARLLRNFIRSTTNQVALGTLLGNFVLCLIVLRSVRSIEDGEFIPHVAAFTAFVCTLGSLATFILFIHHIAISLQADHIVATVHEELEEALERYFPDDRPEDSEEQEADEEKKEWESLEGEVSLSSPKTGYVQAVNISGLVAESTEHGVRCRVLRKPGQFVNEGTKLIAVSSPDSQPLDDSRQKEFVEKILIGKLRTAEQDFEYCLRQLVEIAVRALSPGINDPFTAMNCIDYIGASLAKVATRRLPHRVFKDQDENPRVRIRPTLFGDLVDLSFHQIRQTAGDHPDIAIRLLGALACIAENIMITSHGKSVRSHAEMVASRAKTAAQAECDKADIDEAFQTVLSKLDGDQSS